MVLRQYLATSGSRAIKSRFQPDCFMELNDTSYSYRPKPLSNASDETYLLTAILAASCRKLRKTCRPAANGEYGVDAV
jgi:hypothetical protein